MNSRFPSPEIKAALDRAAQHALLAAKELSDVRRMAFESRAKGAPMLAANVWREALTMTEKASYFHRLYIGS